MLVLGWHNVEGTPCFPSVRGAGIRGFRAQVEWLARWAEVVPLRESLRALAAGERLPPRAVAITFDDGYRDNFEHAAPVLERLSLPATFFVVTQWIDTDIVPWWDAQRGVRHPWMTWAEVRALHERGFEIGAHTRTHVDLGKVSGGDARQEILGGRLELERRLGAPVTSFAYPYGRPDNFTEANRALVRAAGFRCCCSGFGGINTRGTDPFRVRRVPISEWYASPHQFGFDLAFGRTTLHS